MTDRADIIARLEAAKTGSRDLDRLVEIDTGGKQIIEAKNYTTYLDDAVTLVERVLPGWIWYIGKLHGGPYYAALSPQHGQWRKSEDSAAGPAIALLIALFRALQDREKADD